MNDFYGLTAFLAVMGLETCSFALKKVLMRRCFTKEKK
jgi:hypothetical protein